MKCLRIIIILISVSQLIACSNKSSSGDISVIDIEAGLRNSGDLLLSDLVTDVEFIQLYGLDDQTYINRNSMIYSIGQDYIVIGNSDPIEILLFNRDGEFIRKIGRLGKGPGELLRCSNFLLLEDENALLVSDGWGEKFLKYSLDGEFLWEKSCQDLEGGKVTYISDMLCLGSDQIIMFNQNPGGPQDEQVMIFDRKLNFVKGFLPKKQEPSMTILPRRDFLVTDGVQMFCWTVDVDTVYEYLNEDMVPVATLVNTGEGMTLRAWTGEHKGHTISRYIDHPSYHLVMAYKDKVPYVIAQKKDAGDSFHTKSEATCGIEYVGQAGIYNDVFGFSPINPEELNNNGRKWTMILHPEILDAISEMNGDLITCLQKQKVRKPKIRDELVTLLKNQKDNAAPILAIMTLKK